MPEDLKSWHYRLMITSDVDGDKLFQELSTCRSSCAFGSLSPQDTPPSVVSISNKLVQKVAFQALCQVFQRRVYEPERFLIGNTKLPKKTDQREVRIIQAGGRSLPILATQAKGQCTCGPMPSLKRSNAGQNLLVFQPSEYATATPQDQRPWASW